MSGDIRLLDIKDTTEGVETTILLERTVRARESEGLVFHQIVGTYHKIEDFNSEWEIADEQVEKTVLCPKCREPITYFTPNLGELVNFTSMNILDARRLTNALIELLKEEVVK